MTDDHHTAAPDARHYSYARGPATHGHHRVTYVELFFDLVFVYAITQLSHGLIAHPSLLGLFETALLTAAVWNVWIHTTWCTNWADPDKTPVRVMLFLLMGAGLLLSISIPAAFAERALTFAIGYVFIQIARTIFMYRAVMPEISPAHVHNFRLILCWLSAASVLWIVGALLGGIPQIIVWTAAVLFEFCGPATRFYVPGMGKADIASWEIEPAHFAERCALFVIIALGESVLVTGATFEKLPWSLPVIMAFIAAFVATVAMWALYFNIGQERGAYAMTQSSDVGLVARAYTYVHLIIVSGIIITAVGDEFVLAHATGHADTKTLAAIVGGPFIYVLGCGLFKRATAGWFPLSHVVGLGALALAALLGVVVEPWVLTVVTSVLLCIVVHWERTSLGPDAVTKLGDPRKRPKPEA